MFNVDPKNIEGCNLNKNSTGKCGFQVGNANTDDELENYYSDIITGLIYNKDTKEDLVVVSYKGDKLKSFINLIVNLLNKKYPNFKILKNVLDTKESRFGIGNKQDKTFIFTPSGFITFLEKTVILIKKILNEKEFLGFSEIGLLVQDFLDYIYSLYSSSQPSDFEDETIPTIRSEYISDFINSYQINEFEKFNVTSLKKQGGIYKRPEFASNFTSHKEKNTFIEIEKNFDKTSFYTQKAVKISETYIHDQLTNAFKDLEKDDFNTYDNRFKMIHHHFHNGNFFRALELLFFVYNRFVTEQRTIKRKFAELIPNIMRALDESLEK